MKKRLARSLRDRSRGPRDRIRRVTGKLSTSFDDGDPVEELPEYDTERVTVGGEP